jgi:NADPH:quinone reductase-like Zn-dependent oxidoreductase
MVTGVCRGANAELVRSLGAARTIDHTIERYQDGPDRYDVVFDTVGVLGEREGVRLLTPGGRMLVAVMGLRQTVRVLVRRRGVLRGGIVTERRGRLVEVLDLAARGVVRPVIGWRGGLHEVSAAHALADSGRKVGSAVIEMPCERAGNGVV